MFRGLVSGFILLAASVSSSVSFGAIPDHVLSFSFGKAMSNFEHEQREDGSWTALITVSSVMYNAHVVFLYEYIGKLEEKRPIVDGLMQFIWSQQIEDGGMPSYPGGRSDYSVSLLAYLAAKISGEDDSSARMKRLDAYLQEIRASGKNPPLYLAYPYLVLFEVIPDARCTAPWMRTSLQVIDGQLPWVRTLLIPLMYLYGSGKTHRLDEKRFPHRIAMNGNCPGWAGGLVKATRWLNLTEGRFWKWMENHVNRDGTFFDYTPTTVPALMAFSKGGSRYVELLEKGVKTLESFQVPMEQGIYQSPGEASVGETAVVLNGLLDAGFGPDHEMVSRAEAFLLAEQQVSGGFGFSKENIHFPDSDDTAMAIHGLMRLQLRKPEGERDPKVMARLEKGAAWLLKLQNKDGGFATWERSRIPGMNRIAKRTGLVLSESVVEHTARVVICLNQFRGTQSKQARRFEKAYRKAIRYLQTHQNADGSYNATWTVNYLFGTSMVLAALATDAGSAQTDAAIEMALDFVLSQQREDGGFSESPESFVQRKPVQLDYSSPAQTGMIASSLIWFLRAEKFRHLETVEASLDAAVIFLLLNQYADGRWHDPTWTGVTFPGVEYLIYPYVQEFMPALAVGMYQVAQPDFVKARALK